MTTKGVTRWWCRECASTDVFVAPEGLPWYGGLDIIRDQHSQASGSCQEMWGLSYVYAEVDQNYAVCRHHSCAAITVAPNAAGWGFGLCPRHLVDREAVR